VVSSAALVLTRLAPGDFTSELYGTASGAAEMARERARYGLDQPIGRQYLAWLQRAVRLDFGTSLLYRRPVVELVAQRAAHTALLAVAALVLATLIGLPAGIVSGSRPNGWARGAIRGVSLVLLSTPSLVTSLLLVLVAARTGWLPTGGMQQAGAWDAGTASGLFDLGRHLILPSLALALPVAATLERVQSQAMREVLGMPFVMAATARGVPRRRILLRSALRPAIVPVAAVYGFLVGSLLSGSFIVEVTTSWPGLGRLMYDALRSRDLYLVAGCAAAGSLFLAVGTLLSDLVQAWADPRLRDETSAAPAGSGA
jgi:peptide/nickel transport system permease protein